MTLASPRLDSLAYELAQNTLFEGLPDSAMAKIADQMQVFEANAGRMLIQHGDTDDDVYFLISGRVIGQMVSDTGREIVFTEMRPGSYFGELAALDGATRSITVSVSAPARIARLRGSQFNNMLHEHAIVAVNLAVELSRRIRRMNERVFGLVVHDVETRVRMHLLRLAQEQGQLAAGGVLEPAPTHEEMATYVGANREAVSRAITKLNKAGVINASRQRVVFEDWDALLVGLDVAAGDR